MVVEEWDAWSYTGPTAARAHRMERRSMAERSQTMGSGFAPLPEALPPTTSRAMAHGVAIIYGARSKPITDWRGTFYETVLPGAATRSIDREQVYGYHEHSKAQPLASMKLGTLRFYDTPTGLRYEMDLPDNDLGKTVERELRAGRVAGSSIGFKGAVADWTDVPEGRLRSVRSMQLFDLSTVARPAYPTSTARYRFGSATPGWVGQQSARSQRIAHLTC